MKDQLIAVCEALRLAQLELDCYRDPLCGGSSEWTINRLDALLNDPAVRKALAVLLAGTESPSLVPEDDPQEMRRSVSFESDHR
jgi:hypothetical protein